MMVHWSTLAQRTGQTFTRVEDPETTHGEEGDENRVGVVHDELGQSESAAPVGAGQPVGGRRNQNPDEGDVLPPVGNA